VEFKFPWKVSIDVKPRSGAAFAGDCAIALSAIAASASDKVKILQIIDFMGAPVPGGLSMPPVYKAYL
jgi:hypothetical protein